MRKTDLRPALVVAVLALTACSGPTTTASSNKEPEKAETAPPPAAVTAKTAFWQTYKSAHAWAPDVLPLKVEAKSIKAVENADGKAGMWECTFGSATRKQFAKFTYAVAAEPPDVRKGVTAGVSVPWAGPTRDALAFETSDFAVDSDDAYKTAMIKAGPFLKDHPDIKLSEMSMGDSSRFPGPVWYFMWGDKKLGFFQLISATTGKAFK